jgi:cold shock CspA family protein
MPAWLTSQETVQTVLLSIACAILWAILKWTASSARNLLGWATSGIRRTLQAPAIERLTRRLDAVRSLHASPSVFIARALREFMGLLILLLILTIGQATLQDMTALALRMPWYAGSFTATPVQILQVLIVSAIFLQLWALRTLVTPVANFSRFEKNLDQRITALRQRMISSRVVREGIKQVEVEAGTNLDVAPAPPVVVSHVEKAATQARPSQHRDERVRQWYRGRIKRWGPRFGFIEREDGVVFFADPRSLVGKEPPKENDEVLFWSEGKSDRKHERAIVVLVRGQRAEGVVAGIPPGLNYSVVIVTDGKGNHNYILLPHAREENIRTGAKSFQKGTQIEFLVDRNNKGPLAVDASAVVVRDEYDDEDILEYDHEFETLGPGKW